MRKVMLFLLQFALTATAAVLLLELTNVPYTITTLLIGVAIGIPIASIIAGLGERLLTRRNATKGQ